MRTHPARLSSAIVAVVVLAAGCAGHEREALHQPAEPNYADPADPSQRPIEGLEAIEPRGRVDAPAQAVPEVDAPPGAQEAPEELDPDERDE